MEVDDPWAFMDGWLDGKTYLQQLGLHADWWGNATKQVLDHHEWDLAFSWVGTIDHIEHVLYSGIEPKARVYDPARADWCMHMIRNVYMQVDANIGKILSGINLDETYVVLISDHGMTHLDWNPYVKEHLARQGLLEYILDLTNDDPSNLKINWKNTKCHPLEPCHAHIFINLKGRDPQGIVEPADYEKVQEEIIQALYTMKNPENGTRVVALALKKKEAGALGIYEGPGYDRIGDVIYAWNPGYMSHPFVYRTAIKYRDGSERIVKNPELYEPAVLCGNFTGVHLALPTLHEMHAVMVMAGPGVSHYERRLPAKIIDVAPTISKIMGMAVPSSAEGAVLYDIIDRIDR
jgi:predicted AlkP superfamily phosphohydrolase/phosphomutase